MSRKTRKLIWSAPLVAVLAVAGALAIFVVLSPQPGGGARGGDARGPRTGYRTDGRRRPPVTTPTANRQDAPR